MACFFRDIGGKVNAGDESDSDMTSEPTYRVVSEIVGVCVAIIA